MKNVQPPITDHRLVDEGYSTAGGPRLVDEQCSTATTEPPASHHQPSAADKMDGDLPENSSSTEDSVDG